MKSAKEMFEELGYKVLEEDKYWLVYGKDKVDMLDLEFYYSKRVVANEYIIKFGKPYKTIKFESGDNFTMINIEELQAINKQVEELWGDDILKSNGNK